jgi:hypothetical protein
MKADSQRVNENYLTSLAASATFAGILTILTPTPAPPARECLSFSDVNSFAKELHELVDRSRTNDTQSRGLQRMSKAHRPQE